MASTSQQQTASDDQQFPLAAQIPLTSFTLPTFPPAASRLRSLTLTSDINLNDYQTKHLVPGTFEPSTTIPSSITHLTLELFSLGFPGPFLSDIAKRLPNLQSLTLFSCLIDGLDDSTRRDAVGFFKAVAPSLRELHVVDTYARAGLWREVGEVFSSISPANSDVGLKLLEVSHTYRGHYESDFLNRIAGEEWPNLIIPSLVGVSFNFSPPPEEAQETEAGMQAEKPEDQDDLKAQDGILPFASDGRASLAIKKRFEDLTGKTKREGEGLKVLNLSMFTLRSNEIGEIAYACAASGPSTDGLVGLTASILLEEKWLETLTAGLGHQNAGAAIESLEIVGVPLTSSPDVAAEDAEKLLMKSKVGLQTLLQACPKLDRFEMSVLKSRRIGNVIWEKVQGEWAMQRNNTAGL